MRISDKTGATSTISNKAVLSMLAARSTRPSPTRRAAVDWTEFLDDLGPPAECRADRSAFLAHVRAYFELQGLQADWDTIDKTPLTLLVNKIVLTIISFVLLYTLWSLANRRRMKAGN